MVHHDTVPVSTRKRPFAGIQAVPSSELPQIKGVVSHPAVLPPPPSLPMLAIRRSKFDDRTNPTAETTTTTTTTATTANTTTASKSKRKKSEEPEEEDDDEDEDEDEESEDKKSYEPSKKKRRIVRQESKLETVQKLMRNHDISEAKRVLQEIIDADVDDLDIATPVSTTNLFGTMSTRRSRKRKMSEIFESLLSYACILVSEGQYVEALKHCNKVINSEEDNMFRFEAIKIRAQAHELSGQEDKAKADYRFFTLHTRNHTSHRDDFMASLRHPELKSITPIPVHSNENNTKRSPEKAGSADSVATAPMRPISFPPPPPSAPQSQRPPQPRPEPRIARSFVRTVKSGLDFLADCAIEEIEKNERQKQQRAAQGLVGFFPSLDLSSAVPQPLVSAPRRGPPPPPVPIPIPIPKFSTSTTATFNPPPRTVIMPPPMPPFPASLGLAPPAPGTPMSFPGFDLWAQTSAVSGDGMGMGIGIGVGLGMGGGIPDVPSVTIDKSVIQKAATLDEFLTELGLMNIKKSIVDEETCLEDLSLLERHHIRHFRFPQSIQQSDINNLLEYAGKTTAGQLFLAPFGRGVAAGARGVQGFEELVRLCRVDVKYASNLRSVVLEKYGMDFTRWMQHMIMFFGDSSHNYEELKKRCNEIAESVTLGKWGPTKRLEYALKVFFGTLARNPNFARYYEN